MPELPEVEIVRQSLDKKIKQKKVKKVIVRNRNLRTKIPLNFPRFLEGKKIIKVKRFSKYLIICLSNQSYCLLHLGMSGTIHLIYNQKKSLVTNTSFYSSPTLPKKHNHVEIVFDDLKIVYNDPRRFGFFEIVVNKHLLDKRFSKLGPEPFQSEFNLSYIYSFLKGKTKNIKNFLLDQNFVSGIGNIYASEILFDAKISPLNRGKDLNKYQIGTIIQSTKKILKKAIKLGGSTINDYISPDGTLGNFQNNFRVYGKEGKKIRGYKIKKIVLYGRSTFFCPDIQK